MTAIEDFLNDTGPTAGRNTPDTIESTSDRWGRHVYTDDLPPCPLTPSGETVSVIGVTSQLKPMKSSFEDHAAKTVATWAVENHHIWASLDRDAAIALVAGERKRALDKASARGLSIHKVVDAAREGSDSLVVSNPDAAPYLAAVKSFLAEAKPEFVMGEVAVFSRTHDYGGKFDVAIVNAGISGVRVAPLESPTEENFDAVMRTNVLGPMRVIPQVVEALAPGARLAVLSSRMGSIGSRTSATSWLYRASKAAVNSVLKDAALTLGTRAACVAFHPGWVKTDMGGTGADIDVATSVAGMRRVIAALQPSETGAFRNYDGETIPW